MPETTMLLISEDPAVVEASRSAGRSFNNLKITVLPRIESAYTHESWDEVALVAIHQPGPGPTTEIGRLLRMISAARRPVATLVLGPRVEAEQSQALFRLGVADYLELPVDAARLTCLIEVLTVRARLGTPGGLASPGQPKVAAAEPFDEIFDDRGSPEVARLLGQLSRVAPLDATVLLGGETGTGKTRLARYLHELSRHREGPLVRIACGSLSAPLIESEMFGHAKGSFPGADADRAGKFAEVGGGTLFLDEVDLLPPSIQVKLLRAVEDRTFEPIGSSTTLPLRARLVVASNRPLEEEVAAGRFRSDLYYRLNVVALQLPPLRDRKGAIGPLARRFAAEFAAKLGREAPEIADDALRVLAEHDWPGNIRELRNVIEQAVSLRAGPRIELADLPSPITQSPTWSGRTGVVSAREASAARVARATLAQIKGEAELARITEALEKHSNNRLRAAGELGISRMTLYKKLYKYGLMHNDGISRGGVA